MSHDVLVEDLFCYNAHFIITLFLLGSHYEHYNEVAVYFDLFCSKRTESTS